MQVGADTFDSDDVSILQEPIEIHRNNEKGEKRANSRDDEQNREERILIWEE